MAEYDARTDGSTESDVLVIDQTEFTATQTMTRPDGETVERQITQATCLCGCGGVPTGKKSRFIQGHDATLKGRLTRAHLNNIPVAIVKNGARTEWTALDYADALGWGHFLHDAQNRESDKRVRAQARKEEMERLKQEREAKKAAATTPDSDFPLSLKLFGREFPARVLSEETDGTVVYEYRKKDGSTNTHVLKPEPGPITPSPSPSAATEQADDPDAEVGDETATEATPAA